MNEISITLGTTAPFFRPGEIALKLRQMMERNSRSQVGSILSRVLALLIDGGISHYLCYWLLGQQQFRSFETSLGEGFGSLLGVYSARETWGFFAFWYLIFQIYRFLLGLLLGRSFGQKAMGLSYRGPWWWKRLAAGANAFIDFFLAPFIVFDFSLLKGKRTLKEKISGAVLKEAKGKSIPWGGAFLSVVILLSGLVMAPFFYNFNFFHGAIVQFKEIKKAPLRDGENFSEYRTYKSEKFHMTTFSDLTAGRFLLLPDFEIVRTSKALKIVPYLLIFDKELNSTGELSIEKRLSLLDILRLGKILNPHFERHFKAIHRALSNKDHFKIRPYRQEWGSPYLLEEVVRKEIKTFLQAAFELGPENLLSHINRYGPFIRGFIEVRQAILSLLIPGYLPEVDQLHLGNADFLHFKQVREDIGTDLKRSVEFFMPLDTQNSFLMKISWQYTLAGALSSQAFRESFLSRAEWYFDYEKFFTREEKSGEWTALSALDLLGKGETEISEQQLLQEFLLIHYRSLAKMAVINKNEVFKKVVYHNMKRLQSVFALKNKRKERLFDDLFLDQWQETLSALTSENHRFFKGDRHE